MKHKLYHTTPSRKGIFIATLMLCFSFASLLILSIPAVAGSDYCTKGSYVGTKYACNGRYNKYSYMFNGCINADILGNTYKICTGSKSERTAGNLWLSYSDVSIIDTYADMFSVFTGKSGSINAFIKAAIKYWSNHPKLSITQVMNTGLGMSYSSLSKSDKNFVGKLSSGRLIKNTRGDIAGVITAATAKSTNNGYSNIRYYYINGSTSDGEALSLGNLPGSFQAISKR